MQTVPTIQLNDGRQIPQLGFGVFQIDPSDTAEAVRTALEIGYRHIDTAEMYENEGGVGQGVREFGIDRGDVWITSKLNNNAHEPDDARRAFDNTLSELGSDYVDLFLIHWPLPTLYDGDFVSTWKTLGISNFLPEHLERLLAEADVVPAVNQIEVHPYMTNRELREVNQNHGIATESYSPIAQGQVLDDPALEQIAGDVGKSVAQVVLRWHIQRGLIIFPKSTTRERIVENFEIFDFELSDDQLDQIDGLDRGTEGRTGADPATFDLVPG